MTKTILITGATGYLGKNILPKLVGAGYTCLSVGRSNANLVSLEKIFKENKIDCILHLATSYGRKQESLIDILEVNLNLPVRLLNLAMKNGVKLFINTDTVLLPQTNAYALSKAQFREWGLFNSQYQKTKFLNIRLQHMFGPDDDEAKFTSFIIRSCLRNEPKIELSEGYQKRDFLYIEDVVSAYMHLLKLPDFSFGYFEEFELGSGNAISVREFTYRVHELTASTSELEFGNKAADIIDYVADITKLKQLGWSPQFSLNRGLIKTIQGESRK